VEDAAPVRIAQPGQTRAARLRQTPGDLFERRSGAWARHPHHRDRHRRTAGREGKDGVTVVHRRQARREYMIISCAAVAHPRRRALCCRTATQGSLMSAPAPASTLRENRLAGETSPYLLQHKHNPVDWWPWGPPALTEAKRSGKPILLSVGYA